MQLLATFRIAAGGTPNRDNSLSNVRLRTKFGGPWINAVATCVRDARSLHKQLFWLQL